MLLSYLAGICTEVSSHDQGTSAGWSRRHCGLTHRSFCFFLTWSCVTLVDTYSRQRALKHNATPSWSNWTIGEGQFALGQ